MTDEKIEFDELGITFGQQLLLHPNPTDKNFVFNCTLIGCLEQQSLIIGPASGDPFPELTEGQRVLVRMFLDSGVALFSTIVLFISEQPCLMIYIDFPESIPFKRLRAAKRVIVAHPILVSNHTNKSVVGVAGKLIDVRTGGGKVEMFDELGEEGDTIEIKGKFEIHGISRLLTVQAIIRKKSNRTYGVQFVEQDEDKLIILMGFIFDAMITGTVNVIR